MKGAPLILSLAWRNLWRNKRRTLVILFAMVLGVWAMIVTAAFMRGMSIQVLNDTIENLTGHLQIHAPKYLDDPVIDHTISLDDHALLQTLKNPDIQNWTSRIRVPAVIASERESTGLVLVGIDPEPEAAMSFIKNAMSEGRYLESLDDNGVLIGKKLAERLETELGKRIVIMAQNKHNEIADRGFRIVGIFDTQLEANETGYVFMARNTAANLLSIDNNVSEIAVLTTDLEMVDQVVDQIRTNLPELDTKAWHELSPFTRLIVEMYSDFHLIWHLIVFLAMGFGIINTLLMAVFERTREFGLFQALGLKPGFILGQVWCEALLLLLIGLLVGNFVSWLTVLSTGEGIDVSAFAQGMEMAQLSNIIPFIIIQKDLILANSVVLILGMLTGLYPAWRASRLVPADAITRI